MFLFTQTTYFRTLCVCRPTKSCVYCSQIYLINIIGQSVRSWNITNIPMSNEMRIPVKNISQGNYIVKVETNAYYLSETVSIKNTSQKSVSCHDYRAEDFIRVLEISDTKLADYFHFYQQFGSHKSFDEGLPQDFSVEEFEQLLKPYAERLVEWALTGKHDVQRLIEPETQTSNYILINKPEAHRFTDYDSYIEDMNRKSKRVYGVPLGWTYPSKKRGERIQLKMPVII